MLFEEPIIPEWNALFNKIRFDYGTDIRSALFILCATTISIYVKRFNSNGIHHLLHDKTGKPEKKPISDETKNTICKLVCTTKPENAIVFCVDEKTQRLSIGKNRFIS